MLKGLKLVGSIWCFSILKQSNYEQYTVLNLTENQCYITLFNKSFPNCYSEKMCNQ